MKAKKRGDRSALGRLGDRIGPARLAQAIGGADERVAEAALAAAPLARGGDRAGGRARRPADGVGCRRARRPRRRRSARLLDGAVPTALEDWDVPPDLVARACGGLRALAARQGGAAARAAGGARRHARGGAELRRRRRLGRAGARSGARDPARRGAGGAAGAAARRSCATGSATATAPSAAPRRPPTAASRGGSSATARRRRPRRPRSRRRASLATAPTTPPADAVEMLDCLAAGGTAADRALLDQLRQGPASPLRDRAIELAALARGKGSSSGRRRRRRAPRESRRPTAQATGWPAARAGSAR